MEQGREKREAETSNMHKKATRFQQHFVLLCKKHVVPTVLGCGGWLELKSLQVLLRGSNGDGESTRASIHHTA